jgi:DNA-binding NtrC family response regulator
MKALIASRVSKVRSEALLFFNEIGCQVTMADDFAGARWLMENRPFDVIVASVDLRKSGEGLLIIEEADFRSSKAHKIIVSEHPQPHLGTKPGVDIAFVEEHLSGALRKFYMQAMVA